MWQRNTSGEEQEHKKINLNRSVLKNRNFLSPIIEKPESVSPHLDAPGSPQPDLIIELIHKPNLYDEPEEFYIALEKEMRWLYRRDFLNEESDSSNYDYDTNFYSENVKSEHADDADDFHFQTNEHLKNKRINSESSASEEIIENIIHDYVNTDIRHVGSNSICADIMSPTFTQRSDYTDYSDTTDSDDVVEVTTQAEIHETNDNEMDSSKTVEDTTFQEINKSLRGWSTVSTVILGKTADECQIAGVPSDCRSQEQTIIAEIDDVRTKSSECSSSSTSLPEPEAMRQRQTLESFASISYRDSTKSANATFVRSRSLSMEVDTTVLPDNDFAPAGEIEDFSKSIHSTSTPKSVGMSFTFETTGKKRKKQLVPYSFASSSISSSSPSSPSSTSDVDVAEQTSISDNETKLKKLCKQIFIGEPVIYKLCSCSDHVCS